MQGMIPRYPQMMKISRTQDPPLFPAHWLSAVIGMIGGVLELGLFVILIIRLMNLLSGQFPAVMLDWIFIAIALIFTAFKIICFVSCVLFSILGHEDIHLLPQRYIYTIYISWGLDGIEIIFFAVLVFMIGLKDTSLTLIILLIFFGVSLLEALILFIWYICVPKDPPFPPGNSMELPRGMELAYMPVMQMAP